VESTKNKSSTGFVDRWRLPANMPLSLISKALGSSLSSHGLQLQEVGSFIPFYRGTNQDLLTYNEVRIVPGVLVSRPQNLREKSNAKAVGPEYPCSPKWSVTFLTPGWSP
jgi:hypothetical protein